MTVKRLCFWLHFPSMHHVSLLNEVAIASGIDVTVVFDANIPAERLKLGWVEPTLHKCKVYHGLSNEDREALIVDYGQDCVHVFFGIHAYRGVYYALQICHKLRRRFFVWTEPVNCNGLKGIFRKLIYCTLGLRYSKSLYGVFVTGTMGFSWLKRSCFGGVNLIPFCYSVPVDKFDAHQTQEYQNKYFRILYVGQFIARKRLDLLVTAFSKMNDANAVLTFIGSGPLMTSLQMLGKRLGISNRLFFKGTKSNDQTLKAIGEHDLLVLPSDHDGWGYVVSEALSLGTPVVVSDRCGAQDLVVNEEFGFVFRHGSIDDLRLKLNSARLAGCVSPDRRFLIRAASLRRFSSPVVAKYIISYLTRVDRNAFEDELEAPWLRGLHDQNCGV